MFGIIASQVDTIAVLNNSIRGAVAHTLAHDTATQAMNQIAAQWQALRAQFDPNLGMLTDTQATQYINALQNIANRTEAIINDDVAGFTSNQMAPGFFTPAAVAGGSGGVPGMTDFSKYVTPGTTTANPVSLDPSKPGFGTTPIKVSTADQIKQISDSIFGAVASGAKQIFEIKAMAMAAKGQPINVPSNITSPGGGLSTNEKLGIGGVAVLGIGLLIFALARRGK